MNQAPHAARSQAAPDQPAETPERILDAAERLFAAQGVEAVSIRDITQAADVNLGAINYHFGSKQALVVAVFRRRMVPLNERRLALLTLAEARSGRRPVALESILEALIRPAVEAGFATPDDTAVFMRLLGRMFSEPNPELQPALHSLMAELRQRFDAALLRASPGLTEEELFWRINFIIGTLHHSLLLCGKLDVLPPPLRQQLDADRLTKRLVSFAAAGFRSSVPA